VKINHSRRKLLSLHLQRTTPRFRHDSERRKINQRKGGKQRIDSEEKINGDKTVSKDKTWKIKHGEMLHSLKLYKICSVACP